MSIQIYNSLTRQKEKLVPLDGKIIKMYTCGVTVYDKCHIGHARSLYVFEVIRSYIEQYSGYKISFVRNITDVDDKIINKGKELNKSFDDVVKENIEAYYKDLENLGIRSADKEPRATQYIDKIITFIEDLIAKDAAYEVEGNVYFNVRAFGSYGGLSRQSVDQMLETTRIDQDAHKKDALDFALWKTAKEGEKFWSSPWGDGRPGWHIECSCMSMNELNCETLDIHAGGRDLIFPHHENEIAQSEALTGKQFAKVWIHHGLLTINGQKMAKSLGNFITVDEILEKFSSSVLKLFFCQSHYSSPIDFSWDKLEEVKRAYSRIEILLKRLEGMGLDRKDIGSDKKIHDFFEQFKNHMNDDFNTPRALAVVYDLVSDVNRRLDEGGDKGDFPAAALNALITMADLFGLDFAQTDKQEDVNQDILDLLEARVKARVDKDYQKSDEIRDALKDKGVIVEDGKDGQTWRYA